MLRFRSFIAVAIAAAMALSSLETAPARAAPADPQQAKPAVTVDLSAHRRYYGYRRGGDRAALAMFGMMMGTIATLAARDQARRDCRRYGYCDGYYGYYRGYPPPYHYRYRRYYPY